MARLCVYCIISALEARSQNSSTHKKRTRSNDGDEHDLNAAKMRKITADGSDNSCSNDFLSENSLLLSSSVSLHSNSLRETPAQLKESLQSAMQYIFKVFQQFVTTDELSPKIYFVYQFITLLVECGKERVRPVLKLLPPNLINNLIKVLLTDDINVGLIARFVLFWFQSDVKMYCFFVCFILDFMICVLIQDVKQLYRIYVYGVILN